MKLRRLTESGVSQFAAWLIRLKIEPTLAPPRHLLTEEGSSEPLPTEVEIEDGAFATRLDAARYLDQVLSGAGLGQVERDAGLWTWLTLFYFDQLCPPGKSGARKPGQLARYIPEVELSRRYYRHMLLGPVLMLRLHSDAPERLLALLSDPPHVATPETYRLFIEHPTLISCEAAVATATWLYFDRARGRLKRGAGSKDAGGCRRLIAFLQQIDCTYDLPLLTQNRLAALLPAEFRRFQDGQLPLLN